MWESYASKPFNFIRSEEKNFTTHRRLVPATGLHIKNGDSGFCVTVKDGSFFGLTGVFRLTNPDWWLSYAVETI